MTNHKKEYVFLGTLMSITTLSGLILSSPSSHADTSGTVTLTVDVPASCSLTVDPSSHTATINPGNTGLIGTSTIKSICNDPAGLAVYAVGYTGDTYGNNNLSTTVGSNTINIPTNVTPSGTPESSEWYMTLAAVSGDYTPTITTGYDSAHIIPNVYTKVAYRNTMTDIGENATGANFTAQFNAYIAPTQAAGTYEGKVKFLLVHPNVLTYNDQTGEPDTVQPATLACEPAEYGTFDSSVTHYLQDVAQWENQVALEQEVTAYDRRDNQAYKVKRLKMSADGCDTALWMSNLNLGAQAFASGVTELNSTNTNLASGVTAISATDFMNWDRAISGNAGSFTDPKFTPLTALNTCKLDDAPLNDYVSSSCPEQDSYGNKYGTLYNYAAASAGTYAYADGEGTGNATSDLCPSGWRMPTGNRNTTGEFQALTDAYDLFDSDNLEWNTGGSVSIQQTLGFSLAGSFHVGEPHFQGSEGIYWSSTFDDGGYDMMCVLYFREDYLDPALAFSRYIGYSVRCIAQ